MGATHAANYILHPFMPPQAASKLKRHCGSQQQQKVLCCSAHIPQRPRRPANTSGNGSKPQLTTLAQPMPRCSSFGSSSALPQAAVGQQRTSSLPTTDTADPHYVLWKSSFEERNPSTPSRSDCACIHNITEAISGQLTPKGFPSYTPVGKKNAATQTNNNDEEQPLPACMSPKSMPASGTNPKARRRLSLRLQLPLLKSSPKQSQKIAQQTATKSPKTKQKSTAIDDASLKPFEPRKPIFLSKLPTPQAKVVERLYEEIRDWQDYYGTRLDYYYL